MEMERLYTQNQNKVKTEERQLPEEVKEGIVKKREFKNIRTVSERVTEFTYRPGKYEKPYRVEVLRKNLSVEREKFCYLMISVNSSLLPMTGSCPLKKLFILPMNAVIMKMILRSLIIELTPYGCPSRT